jgi:hypothetical protein
MLKILRHILLLLVACAIVSGTTSELARSAQYGSVLVSAGMPCDMTMPSSISGEMKPMTPCKGMTPDCIKAMGCVTVSALPAHFLTHESTMRYSAIDYWTSHSKLAGLDRQPEPLPPRTT